MAPGAAVRSRRAQFLPLWFSYDQKNRWGNWSVVGVVIVVCGGPAWPQCKDSVQEQVGVSPKVRLCRAQFCPVTGQLWRAKARLPASLCTLLCGRPLSLWLEKKAPTDTTTTNICKYIGKSPTTDKLRFGKIPENVENPYGNDHFGLLSKIPEFSRFSGNQ